MSSDGTGSRPENTAEIRMLLRATTGALLDPQVLLEAARDSSGHVVDFLFTEVNQATCDCLGLSREELIGRGVLETMPGIKDALFPDCLRCLDTGEPLRLDGFSYDSEGRLDTRRYDLRVTRATSKSLVLTWRDVTDRFHAAELIAGSEARLRASVDSMINPHVVLGAVRDSDGRVVDFRYLSVNRAACAYLGLAEDELIGHNGLETSPHFEGSELAQRYVQCLEDGEPVVLDDYPYFNEILDDGRRYDIRATRAGADLLCLTWCDVTERFLAAQRLAASEQRYRLLAENSGDVVCHLRDGQVVWVSPSIEAALGKPPDYWLGRSVLEFVPPEDASVGAAMLTRLADGSTIRERIRVVATDGVAHWFDMFARPFYAAEGHQDGVVAALRLVDDQVAAEQSAEDARERRAKSDARYRRSMATAAIGMGLLAPDGRFVEVNPALCELLGYAPETLIQKTWQELTPPEHLAVGDEERDAIFGGRSDSYRIVKQYIHADGHRIWVDVSVNCVRDENGEVENLAIQIVDITATVNASERNYLLTKLLEEKSQRLAAELESAADYMKSIMPQDLTGKVPVTSRYLPSREVGGDCFNYSWIDEDHLLVYLIDVSGHGIEPALLAVSVHNLLRSGSFTTDLLREPHEVLAALNRLFQMDKQGGHYFTMWFGVYEAPTRTLRYASAGAPPALAFNATSAGEVSVTELFTPTMPVGMFDDAEFTSRTYAVPSGCRILIYSDGASEITLDDGKTLSHQHFMRLTTRVAQSPEWSLDQVIAELQALGQSSGFEDDCSLIQIAFD